MAEHYPQLVHKFKAVSAYNQEPIGIGGVQQGSEVQITHIINYKLPFTIQGQGCGLVFGLAEGAAATAVVSITFLTGLGALWNFDATDPSVYLQRWNISLQVKYKAPICQPPPQQSVTMPEGPKTLYLPALGEHQHHE